MRAYSETGLRVGPLGQQGVTASPVDAATRSEDQSPDPVEVTRLDEDLGGLVVEVQRLLGIEVARRIPNNGRQRDHAVHTSDTPLYVPNVADVALNDLEVGMVVDARQSGGAVGEVVEHADSIPALEQRSRKVRADVARASGHEHDGRAGVDDRRRPSGERVGIDQVAQCDAAGLMDIPARKQPLDARQRTHADAEILGLLDQAAKDVFGGGRHGHHQLAHVVAIHNLSQSAQWSQDRGAIHVCAYLGRVIVQESHQLHVRRRHPHQIPAQHQPAVACSGDKNPMRLCPGHVSRLRPDAPLSQVHLNAPGAPAGNREHHVRHRDRLKRH